MKEKALYYYDQGIYNCSQSIILAAKDKYNIRLDDELLNGLGNINNGFGIGCMCGVVICAVIIFGMIFEETKARAMRLTFLNLFKSKYKSFNCCQISLQVVGCSKIISDVCDIIDNIIDKERCCK